MTAALVAHKGQGLGGTGGTTGSINTTGANLIVVGITCSTGAPTLSDSASNTWTQLAGQATSGLFESLWYCRNPITSASHTFTAGGSGAAICVTAFSGAGGGIDKNSGNAANPATTIQPGSVTPTVNGEVIVGFVGNGGNVETWSVNSSMTISDQLPGISSNYFAAAMAYLIQPTAGAINPTFTTTFAGSALVVTLATFKPAPLGGAFFLL